MPTNAMAVIIGVKADLSTAYSNGFIIDYKAYIINHIDICSAMSNNFDNTYDLFSLKSPPFRSICICL